MKYYKLIESINNKEIGVYPQVIKTDQALEIQEFGLGYNEHLHKQFILPEPILRNNARETTMISVTAINNNIFLVLKLQISSLGKLTFIIKSNLSMILLK